MSDLEPRQWIVAETPESTILDGMDIDFLFPPRAFLDGDSIAVKHPNGQWFHLSVERPEDTGAVVNCNMPPMFWSLHFHLDHIAGQKYRLRMEKHHVELLEHVFGRTISA
jgi:hypothetical protein